MKKLFLLDAYALIFRGYYGMQRSPRINSQGEDTTAVFGFLNTFEDILRRTEGNPIAVVFDPPGGTFRDELFEDYKGTRESTPDAIAFGVPFIQELIEAFGVSMYEVEGYEADDVIGTLAKQAEEQGVTEQIYLVTPDKDFGQLVTQKIHQLVPQKGALFEELGPKEIAEKHLISGPEQVIDYLALVGDAADNVPGVPGIGKKTAAELLRKYGTIEGIYAAIEEQKGKRRANLEAHHEDLLRSRELVTIVTSVPLSWDISEMEQGEVNYSKLVEIYEQLEFRSKLAKLTAEGHIQQSSPMEPNAPRSLFDLAAAASKPTTAQGPIQVASAFESMESVPKQYHLIETPEEVEALAKHLASVDTFAFDTETSSLDALQCEIVGMSFATKPHEAWYIALSPLQMEAELQLAPLREVMQNEQILKVGQNLKFDLKVIHRYGLATSGPFWDTILAHYLLQPELPHGMDSLSESYLGYRPIPITDLLGPKGKKQLSMLDLTPEQIYRYACEDADVTLQLYHKLRPLLDGEEWAKDLFYQLEMPLMEVLLMMEETGVKVDTSILKEATAELQQELLQLGQDIHAAVGGLDFNINSPKEVGQILFEELKLSDKPKKTKTGQYSTNEEELQKVSDKHPVVGMILRYRGLRKLVNTYIEPLPTLVHPTTGRIHTTYNQASTATGRLSSSNPNLQNIPVRDEDGKQIRRAFTALHPEAGELYLSADYSQIELRLMAHFSQDPHMIEAFRSGADIHTATAAKIYHIPMEEVTSDLRRKAKTANFGINYGITPFGLRNRLNIPLSEAYELIDNYFASFPGVRDFMNDTIADAEELGYVETLYGRRRYIANINSDNANIRGNAERNAINSPIQGSAADIIKIAMCRIAQRMEAEGFQSKMILQVHDELNFSVLPSELDALQKLVKEEMEAVGEGLSVPLIVDIGVGKNWLEAH